MFLREDLVSLMIFIKFRKFDGIEHLGLKFALLFDSLDGDSVGC